MKPKEQLDQALGDLRLEHQREKRPSSLLPVLLDAVQRNPKEKGTKTKLLWLAVSCSLALLLIGLYRFWPVTAGTSSTIANGSPKRAAAAETAFAFLPSSAMLPPSVEMTFVRVHIRKGDLRQFGLDVPETASQDVTDAEFAVGEDGLARAVRFVRPSSLGSSGVLH